MFQRPSPSRDDALGAINYPRLDVRRHFSGCNSLDSKHQIDWALCKEALFFWWFINNCAPLKEKYGWRCSTRIDPLKIQRQLEGAKTGKMRLRNDKKWEP